MRAHPRWRGEHSHRLMVARLRLGSSPLARGARDRRLRGEVGSGLIPAGAGSTGIQARSEADGRAHPRWRGEHLNRPEGLRSVKGSSPLARGAHVTKIFHASWRRLIPAGAGSTLSSVFQRSPPRAHPRWRGEHIKAAATEASEGGSSPLARGARGAGQRAGGQLRLIPAGAGSTANACDKAPATMAHPRWRGEH